jgi:hypothetical protein
VSTAGRTGPNGRGSTRSIERTGSNIRSAGSNGRDWDRDGIEIEGEILSETTHPNKPNHDGHSSVPMNTPKRPPDRQRPTAQPGQPWITRGPVGRCQRTPGCRCPTAPLTVAPGQRPGGRRFRRVGPRSHRNPQRRHLGSRRRCPDTPGRACSPPVARRCPPLRPSRRSNTRALSGNPQPTTTAGVDAEHRPVVEPGGGVVALAAAEDRAQFLGGYPGGRDLAALVAAPETARAVRSLLCRSLRGSTPPWAGHATSARRDPRQQPTRALCRLQRSGTHANPQESGN